MMKQPGQMKVTCCGDCPFLHTFPLNGGLNPHSLFICYGGHTHISLKEDANPDEIQPWCSLKNGAVTVSLAE